MNNDVGRPPQPLVVPTRALVLSDPEVVRGGAFMVHRRLEIFRASCPYQRATFIIPENDAAVQHIHDALHLRSSSTLLPKIVFRISQIRRLILLTKPSLVVTSYQKPFLEAANAMDVPVLIEGINYAGAI